MEEPGGVFANTNETAARFDEGVATHIQSDQGVRLGISVEIENIVNLSPIHVRYIIGSGRKGTPLPTV